MATGTVTRTATQATTYTRIVYVTRKVQADFLAILDTYRYFPEEFAQKLIADVRTFLDDEVIDSVKFTWKESGTSDVLEELRYSVLIGGLGLADDRPGGITYNPALVGADFTVYVTYNAHWSSMTDYDRQVVRANLKLSWGPAGVLNYTKGNWQQDRTYSNDGYAIARQRFCR